MAMLEDRTNQTIQDCLSGRYETTAGDMHRIAITQDANRYTTSVEETDWDCIGK